MSRPAAPRLPDRTLAGLVLPLAVATRDSDNDNDNDGLLPSLQELSAAGVHVVLTAGAADTAGRAPGGIPPPPGPGRRWVLQEHPERATPLALLAGVGVTGRLLLDLRAGPLAAHAREVVDAQLARIRARRVPALDEDPAWTIVEHGVDPARHRVTESLFTLASGSVGMRGSVEETPGFGQPLVVAAGVYDGFGPDTHLLPGPDVVDLRVCPAVLADRRVLDLRTGLLVREEVRCTAGGPGPPLRTARFASLAEPGVLALRVEAAHGRVVAPLERSVAGAQVSTGGWRETAAAAGGGIGAAWREWRGAADDPGRRRSDGSDGRDVGEVATRELLVAFEASARTRPSRTLARRRLARAGRRGFDGLLTAQRAAWATRWDAVDVRIADDPWTERALRFALFQLWSLGHGDGDGDGDGDGRGDGRGGGGELAVGARGLTGPGYRGHVFWDADVFVLPALTTIAPAAADRMVAYRLHRRRAARARAAAEGRAGLRFPWESAGDGGDVTPTGGFVGGEEVAILTGALEEHITADVAWAAVHHATWSRPDGRLRRAERELVRETGRYWAARVEEDPDGTAHLRGVIGPDEYHERVDDDCFTNGMARWNLRAGARLLADGSAERDRWLALADTLADGYDAGRGLHEQFAGYFGLGPLLVGDLATPPIAADVLVGRARLARSQVIKQPDVLMLHHLLPGALRPGSLADDHAFYAPRTAHGSSLSPGISAAVAARAGRPDEALDLLRLGLRLDLDDLGGTTAAGVHVGACGAAWQAVVLGFLGARVVGGALELDPVLPAAWPALEVRFRCRGRDVRVEVSGPHGPVRVAASPTTSGSQAGGLGPLPVRVTRGRGEAGGGVALLGPEREAEA